ncbi:MAG TPA: hypothetical protein VFQ61_37855 [Polyangiaceae bacterium]|nr:hypothetical protein [Polyangiaceae bacterium]
MKAWLLLSGLGIACVSSRAQPSHEATVAGANPPAARVAPKSTEGLVVFTGMCDASGAVPLSRDRFTVADDEDNVLRIYDAEVGGPPLSARDISRELGLTERKRRKTGEPKPAPEVDIEAATRVGDLAFWLTSHGRDSSGRVRQERLRFFATTLPRGDSGPIVVGKVRTDLLDPLFTDSRYATFELAAAARLPPKSAGGLNLEGLTERRDGGVWIGFRSPTPEQKALLAPLLNPVEVTAGAAPNFGDPRLLDLGGLGVRGLSYWRGQYLILAGHHAGGKTSKLYTWDGDHQPREERELGVDGFNPEGFFTPEDRDTFMILSDDGTRPIGGIECKRLEESSQKSFRGLWLRL